MPSIVHFCQCNQDPVQGCPYTSSLVGRNIKSRVLMNQDCRIFATAVKSVYKYAPFCCGKVVELVRIQSTIIGHDGNFPDR